MANNNQFKSANILQEGQKLHQLIGMTFIFSYTWAIAGNIDESCYDDFDTFLRALVEDCNDLKVCTWI